SLCNLLGVLTGLELDQTEIDLAQAAIAEDPDEIQIADQSGSQCQKSGPDTVVSANDNGSLIDFDRPIRLQRSELCTTSPVDQNRVGSGQRLQLRLDFRNVKYV